MPKVSGKNGIVLVNGVNFSTYATKYEATYSTGMIDVTGFSDGGQNFIPGLASAKLAVDMLWDSTATVGVHAVLAAMGTGNITILPEGYTLGNTALTMPFTQGNYSPSGEPAGALKAGTLNFASYGSAVRGLDSGWALAHGTITNTTTGTGFVDPTDSAVTAICAGTLHVWSACAADTYVVKIQHCATIDGVYADLITFTLNGSALGSERVAAASGTINKYRRVLATRTGSAGNSFGFSVAFWHA